MPITEEQFLRFLCEKLADNINQKSKYPHSQSDDDDDEDEEDECLDHKTWAYLKSNLLNLDKLVFAKLVDGSSPGSNLGILFQFDHHNVFIPCESKEEAAYYLLEIKKRL